MLKSNRGVTLVILIVIIIVILILASITISATDSVLTRTRLQNAVTNMKLIQAKVESMNEEYEFNATRLSDYAGTQVEDPDYLNMYGVAILSDDKWYVWDRETLSELGFDKEILKNVESKKDEHGVRLPEEMQEERYVVNYSTGEVIFTTGVKDENDKRVYTVKQITENLYVKKEEAKDSENVTEP